MDRIEDFGYSGRFSFGIDYSRLRLTLSSQDICLPISFGTQNLTLFLTFGSQDRGTLITVGAHLLFHRLLHA